jgi:polysaccharide biosynthesis protein PslG
MISHYWRIILLIIIGLTSCQGSAPPATAQPAPIAATASNTATAADKTPLVSEDAPTATPSFTATPLLLPTLTATPAYPVYEGSTLSRNRIGIQVYLHRVDVPQLVEQLRELGVGWVKVQVSWKLYQPAPEQYSDERFADLDQLVEAAQENNINVLLGVAKAPEWSRPTTEMDGSPRDNDLYRQFMQMLALRYKGRVSAYELWNEPNLQREWNGVPLDAAALGALIRAGAEGVRAADSAALVISGAPAVTGIDDGIVAIDDRRYFRAMLESGVAQVVDGFGVHPYGWANPPDATVANPDTAVPTHNDHPSFFFQDTLQDYGALLTDFNITDKQLWVTEFGWGSFEGFGTAPPAEATFMVDVSEWQQAVYTQRALVLADDWPWVGPMMLWNLNFAPWIGAAFSESGYSLLRPDGSFRPSYFALATIPKQ